MQEQQGLRTELKLPGLLSFAWMTIVLIAPLPCLADESGLKTNVAVDIVGSGAARLPEKIPTKIQVREAELSFYSPIDHLFDGILGLAAHQEDGVAHFEIHEASISSTKLAPASRLRLGQFFLGIGRLNSTHRHDWPFVSAPRVHAEFFGAEGVSDTGLEYATAFPEWAALDVSVGIGNGWTFGHAHSEGKRPKRPTHYARLASFFNLPSDGGLQIAANYLGRTDSEGMKTVLVGTDAVMKWREGRIISFLIQSEVWWREVQSAAGEESKSIGLYIYPQANLIGPLDFGILYDEYRPLNLKDAIGMVIKKSEHSIAPTLSYKNSEFSTFRANYTWQWKDDGEKFFRVSNSFFEIQSVFILGAHPAHEF
jgi:hypothetical protein